VTTVFVAAGSNVEPITNLRRALDLLAANFAPLRLSPVYRNRAVGFEGQDFVNLVVAFETTLTVREVLAILHSVESECGRPRNAPKWAPRTMDLDILLFGSLACDEPGLTLPRPDLVRRPYMLGPMAELEPGLIHPTLGRTMAELWQGFDRTAHPMVPVDCGWPARDERPA
jgi:2-amino-4-hydroxy-6-hydroxymethyldihydropteridine diphosphokinase